MEPSDLYQYLTPLGGCESYDFTIFEKVRNDSIVGIKIHNIGKEFLNTMVTLSPCINDPQLKGMVESVVNKWRNLIGFKGVYSADKKNSPYYKYLRRFMSKDDMDKVDISRFDEFTEDTFCGMKMKMVGEATNNFLDRVYFESETDFIDRVLEKMVEAWDVICFG